MSDKPIAIFWFRRDLRLEDNRGFFEALNGELPVLPLFIFDSEILSTLTSKTDARVEFIHLQIAEMNKKLMKYDSSLLIRQGKPAEIWEDLPDEYNIAAVYFNEDYEPYARQRDDQIIRLLNRKNLEVNIFKDQVIFAKNEILTENETSYSVYTPYMKKWKSVLNKADLEPQPSQKYLDKLIRADHKLPGLEEIGFQPSGVEFPPKLIDEEVIKKYHKTRDYPAIDGTSRLGIHLRFGTISIRQAVRKAFELNETWLDELIWRDFFMMILWHHPRVVDEPFREKYSAIKWRNNEIEFEKWCEGKTGYPLVDAGMRELNITGYMHNRVRMVAASFLTKHLLVDWRWGEKYFADRLLDFELSSNNGNWQWAAGCGCDAAPYFRIFNPESQQKKYDPEFKYIKKWIPEFGMDTYPGPMVDHKPARERALEVYKKAVSEKSSS